MPLPDVARYSKLVDTDEERTLARLRALPGDSIIPPSRCITVASSSEPEMHLQDFSGRYEVLSMTVS